MPGCRPETLFAYWILTALQICVFVIVILQMKLILKKIKQVAQDHGKGWRWNVNPDLISESGLILRTDLNQSLEGCLRMLSSTCNYLFTCHLSSRMTFPWWQRPWLPCAPFLSQQVLSKHMLTAQFRIPLETLQPNRQGLADAFFCSCIMHWLQGDSLYPAYHRDETQSGWNREAVFTSLKNAVGMWVWFFRGSLPDLS